MIVKITVNDNDFGDVLVGFCKRFYEYVAVGVDAGDFDFSRHMRFRGMLNPNEDKKLTEEETADLIDRIRQAFYRYISTQTRCKEDTVKYLMKNLEVNIQDTFKDRWENGEAVYWLQHSGAVVNQ